MAGLALVLAVYLAQIARPLHLEHDSVCYLLAAEQAAQGRGFDCPDCEARRCPITYPPGYPALVAGLFMVGMASSTGIFLLNYGSLLLGMGAVFWIARRAYGVSPTAALVAGSLSLMSYPLYRAIPLPLSEFPFFGVSMASLALAVGSEGHRGWRRAVGIGAALALAWAAIKIRTIGIALLPAIVWSALPSAAIWTWLGRRSRAEIAGIVAGAAVAGGVAVFLTLGRSDYLTADLPGRFRDAGLAGLWRTWTFRATEWGEFATNLPEGKMPEPVAAVFPFIGVVALAGLAWLMWRRRRAPTAPDWLILGHTAILAVWPYDDPRFWIPIIPLVAVWLAAGWRDLSPRPRLGRVGLAYLGLFLLVGVAGQAYNTAISYSGDRFPSRFQSPTLRASYEIRWAQSTDSTLADPHALHVLDAFGVPRRRR